MNKDLIIQAIQRANQWKQAVNQLKEAEDHLTCIHALIIDDLTSKLADTLSPIKIEAINNTYIRAYNNTSSLTETLRDFLDANLKGTKKAPAYKIDIDHRWDYGFVDILIFPKNFK